MAGKGRSILIGSGVFMILAILVAVLTYQEYLLYKKAELEKLSQQANAIGENLKTSLSNSLSATRTLAFLVEYYGVPDDFDSVAANILATHKYIDALELTREGVITHVYPREGNEGIIGYDVLADSKTSGDAMKAIEGRELFFAGPLELRQGGQGVVGRLPVFREKKFWGFSVVIIRMGTLLDAAGISDEHPDFEYRISSAHPGNPSEEFFLQEGGGTDFTRAVTVGVPNGEWKLYVTSKRPLRVVARVLPFSLLGLLLSFVCGFFAWQLGDQNERLKVRVKEEVDAHRQLEAATRRSLEHLNRLFQFTSSINHLVIHTKDEQDLYTGVCRIAHEVGKFRLAWIGIIDEGQNKVVEACSSGDVGYLSQIGTIPLEPGEFDGPILKLIRTGEFVKCNDIENDLLMKPWAEIALSYGYRSAIFLPIKTSGRVIGSFNLYSSSAFVFDEEEERLLTETTNNISFALENFERDRRRIEAEGKMHSEKTLSDFIINSLPGIFYVYDRRGNFYRWNKNFQEVSGYSEEEMSHIKPLELFDEPDRDSIAEKIEQVFTTGYTEVIANFMTKDRRFIPYFFNGRKVFSSGREFVIGMGLDITAQVVAQKALSERAGQIEKLSAHLQNIREEERSQIALEIHDVIGQQLTALKMDSSWLLRRTKDEQQVHRITGMISLIDDTIKTVRKISTELRPGILDDLGLIAALEWQGSEFQKNTGIELAFRSNISEIPLERHMSINIFRIYQEALTNITRHANATRVDVFFSVGDDLISLRIRDDGNGLPPETGVKRNSLGMIGMTERARMFKGEVSFENIEPHGTEVRLTVPLKTHITTQPS